MENSFFFKNPQFIFFSTLKFFKMENKFQVKNMDSSIWQSIIEICQIPNVENTKLENISWMVNPNGKEPCHDNSSGMLDDRTNKIYCSIISSNDNFSWKFLMNHAR